MVLSKINRFMTGFKAPLHKLIPTWNCPQGQECVASQAIGPWGKVITIALFPGHGIKWSPKDLSFDPQISAPLTPHQRSFL